ncbi:hypothetical protein P4472_02230 [Bacillus subtilis]|nr:hypothetical protein [Bacillus subtilis]MDM5300074.1 hypothetical protein [Bacillus subtilis]MDM5322127.1 hypothetical protein [Bacillus subtilis]MEC0314080.1 hypothetical protein [Bacillus subtilis]MEC0363546.1 hypothetical protein [Bacillus subtilis]MED3600848.1 hypothetical protein [Bacillus subtilis]
MREQGLFVGKTKMKPAFFSRKGFLSKHSFVTGKAGRSRAHFLTSQYEMCEREGKRIVVVDPKSDF